MYVLLLMWVLNGTVVKVQIDNFQTMEACQKVAYSVTAHVEDAEEFFRFGFLQIHNDCHHKDN